MRRRARRNPPIPYHKYRTGLTFEAVRAILSVEQDAERAKGLYMFVSRSTVLGRWTELKRKMYAHYERDYDAQAEQSRRARAEGLPF